MGSAPPLPFSAGWAPSPPNMQRAAMADRAHEHLTHPYPSQHQEAAAIESLLLSPSAGHPSTVVVGGSRMEAQRALRPMNCFPRPEPSRSFDTARVGPRP